MIFLSPFQSSFCIHELNTFPYRSAYSTYTVLELHHRDYIQLDEYNIKYIQNQQEGAKGHQQRTRERCTLIYLMSIGMYGESRNKIVPDD